MKLWGPWIGWRGRRLRHCIMGVILIQWSNCWHIMGPILIQQSIRWHRITIGLPPAPALDAAPAEPVCTPLATEATATTIAIIAIAITIADWLADGESNGYNSYGCNGYSDSDPVQMADLRSAFGRFTVR